jgi:hypothetical protein
MILFLTLLHFSATAHTIFPSVEDIERDLKLVRGAQFPRDVQAPDGSIFHTYYVGGKDLGNGEYAVIVKLSK